MRRALAGPVLLLCGLAAVPAPRAAAQAAYFPTHGWRRSSPEAQGLDSRALAEAFDYVRRQRIPIHSFLIVRNGYLVLDAYFWPFREGETHDVASVTKSVTSTLVGIALGQGKLSGLDQPVLPLFGPRAIANADARKDRITLRDLLTMTSGLDCHVEQAEVTLRQMMASADWIGFMLDLPMAYEPGRHFSYCSGGMHLLSGVITRVSGASALDYARRELFDPLGIQDVAWPADPQGITRGWGDLHLQPQDMAKIGYLWLKGGRWEDRQLVPAEWLRAAVQVQSHPGYQAGQEYGYGIWVYPDRTPPEFEGLGRGGQRISVIPGRNLVVVFTGGEFEPGDIGQFIGRAIRSDGPLPEDPAAAARLAAAIHQATLPPPARAVPPAPARAATVSGRTYALGANPLALRSFTLNFPGGDEARLELELSDRRDGPRPVGLDGVPRVSPDGRFGLPVALSGTWENDSTFVLEYDEVGNINAFRLRLAFAGDGVTVALSERSAVTPAATFRGTVRR